MAPESPRPTTAADCLEHIARDLSLMDRIVHAHAECLGKTYEPGNAVQLDLSTWAAWLRQHPDIDAQMMSALPKETDR